MNMKFIEFCYQWPAIVIKIPILKLEKTFKLPEIVRILAFHCQKNMTITIKMVSNLEINKGKKF